MRDHGDRHPICTSLKPSSFNLEAYTLCSAVLCRDVPCRDVPCRDACPLVPAAADRDVHGPRAGPACCQLQRLELLHGLLCTAAAAVPQAPGKQASRLHATPLLFVGSTRRWGHPAGWPHHSSNLGAVSAVGRMLGMQGLFVRHQKHGLFSNDSLTEDTGIITESLAVMISLVHCTMYHTMSHVCLFQSPTALT